LLLKKKKIRIIINVEKSCAVCGIRDLFFSGFSDEYKVQKNSIHMKNKYFETL